MCSFFHTLLFLHHRQLCSKRESFNVPSCPSLLAAAWGVHTVPGSWTPSGQLLSSSPRLSRQPSLLPAIPVLAERPLHARPALRFSVQETKELSGLLATQVLLLARLQQGHDVSCSQERVRLLPMVLPLWVCGRLGEQSPWRVVLPALPGAPSSRTAAPGGTLLCHPGDAQTGRTQRVTSVRLQRSALRAVSYFLGLRWCFC